MADTKKITTSAAALALAAATGALAQRTINPPPPSEVRPIMMRWLDEGPGKPNRYALTILTKIAGNAGPREIVCEADGSGPKLNGRVFDTGKDLCQAIAKFGAGASASVGKLSSEFIK